MTAFGDIRAQLGQTCDLIGGFRQNADAGMAIDLTGLDRSVAAVCEAIAQLPATERPPLKDALLGLLDELNALVAALEAQQRDIADNLKGVSSRQRAVAAYGKGTAPSKPAKDTPQK